jgi:hypothetical protein
VISAAEGTTRSVTTQKFQSNAKKKIRFGCVEDV